METTTKSNVPTLIIGAFISFFLFIGYLVYQSFQLDVNLVRDDYYLESTRHDEHMADIVRTTEANIQLYFDDEAQLIVLEAPFEFVEGYFHFYRPSDANLDFKVPIKLINKKQMLSTAGVVNGKWGVRIEFQHQGSTYYKECNFVR